MVLVDRSGSSICGVPLVGARRLPEARNDAVEHGVGGYDGNVVAERGCGEEAVERVAMRPGHGAGRDADRGIETGAGAALLFEQGGEAGE